MKFFLFNRKLSFKQFMRYGSKSKVQVGVGIMSLALLAAGTSVQAQNDYRAAWAKMISTTNNNNGFINSMEKDQNGNLYLVGTYTGQLKLGAITVNSVENAGSPTTDVFAAKVTMNGEVLWLKSIGSSGSEAGNGVAVDASGNVYVSGNLGGNADLGMSDKGNPTVITSTMSGSGFSTDAFVVRYNSDGTLSWAKNFGGTGSEYGMQITCDAAGGLYCIGQSWGANTPFIIAGTTLSTANASGRSFMYKLNTTNGNGLWAQVIGPAAATGGNYFPCIKTDKDNNVILAGYFQQTLAVGADTVTSGGTTYDAVVAKYNSAGGAMWVKKMGAVNVSDYGKGNIGIDNANNIYVTGYVSYSTAQLDYAGNNVPLPVGNGTDAIVAKLNSNGQQVWFKTFGAVGTDQALGVTLNNTQDSIWVVGNYVNPISLNSTISLPALSPGVSSAMFLIKADTAFNISLAKKIEPTSSYITPGSSSGNTAILADNNNNLYACGRLASSIKFDTITLTPLSNTNGASFLVKWVPTDEKPLPVKMGEFNARKVGHTAVLNWETVSEENVRGFYIEKSSNGRDWTTIAFENSQSGHLKSAAALKYNYTDQEVQAGDNYYRLRSTDMDDQYTYSDVRMLRFQQAEAAAVIYPNPVISTLNIKRAVPQSERYTIADVLGKVMMEGVLDGTKAAYKVDVSGLAAGNYFIKIASTNASVSYEFIKK